LKQYDNKISATEMRVLCCMYGKIKWYRIENDNIKERVGGYL